MNPLTTPNPGMSWTCEWCGQLSPYSVNAMETFDGEAICFMCFERDNDSDLIAAYGFGQDEDNNEDPLEGAVEPVGGTPSKDKPLYDRDGTLIGHVPIEEHIFENDDE